MPGPIGIDVQVWICSRCNEEVAEVGGKMPTHECGPAKVAAHRDARIDDIEERLQRLEEVVQP